MMHVSPKLLDRWRDARLDEALATTVLHPRLRALIEAPLVRNQGALLLEPLVGSMYGPELFQDTTSYEAFTNKLHVDDFIDEPSTIDEAYLRELIRQGTKAAVVLAERLETLGPHRVLLSFEAEWPTMVLRFFGRREGQPWGPAVPEGYESEEVLIIDTDATA